MMILVEENKRLNALAEQCESRIREYQALFLKFKNKHNRAEQELLQLQQKKEVEYQQQIAENVEDITQVQQRVNFFKQKNQQLQKRVEQLLSINTELKVQLEQQTQMIKVFESGNLYRYQITILEQNVANLQGKLQIALEENNKLKQQQLFRDQGVGADELSRVRI